VWGRKRGSSDVSSVSVPHWAGVAPWSTMSMPVFCCVKACVVPPSIQRRRLRYLLPHSVSCPPSIFSAALLQAAGEISQAWIVGDIAYADDGFGHDADLFRFSYEDVYNGMGAQTSTALYRGVQQGNAEAHFLTVVPPAGCVWTDRSAAAPFLQAGCSGWRISAASSPSMLVRA
jgi:hypothetical protein